MAHNPDSLQYVQDRYRDAIAYYWHATRRSKRYHRWTRALVIVLGAFVTLVASLASAEFATAGPLRYVFAVGTPLLAAALTIVSGFAQQFQFGASWQDMVMTAQQLEKERDRILVVDPEERDPVKEIELLNDLVLAESRNFFSRLIGSNPQRKDKCPETAESADAETGS